MKFPPRPIKASPIVLWSILALAVSATTYAEQTKTYSCSTVQLGEQLPLRFLKIKSDFLEACGTLCSKEQVIRYSEGTPYTDIPIEWMATEQTFNRRLLKPVSTPKIATTRLHPIKRFVFLDKNKQAHILETRYVDYILPEFSVTLHCDTSQKCEGRFSNQLSSSVLTVDKNTLEDDRPEAQQIRVELFFGAREPSRLIARIFKENVSHNLALNLPTSASGEVAIELDHDQIHLDVGTDEQLQILPEGPRLQRIPAAELKLVCQSTP